MIYSSRPINIAKSLQLAVLALSWFATVGHAQIPAQNRSFEACQYQDDCEATLNCTKLGTRAIGANQCLTSVDGNCVCVPDGGMIPCIAFTVCPEREMCAYSEVWKGFFCVGCNAFYDSLRSFTRVDRNFSKCPPPKQALGTVFSGPARQSFEFCSVTLRCDAGFICRDLRRGVTCSPTSTACRCEPPSSINCTGDECLLGEVCAFETFLGRKLCMGCDFAKRAPRVKFPEGSNACLNIPKMALPSYPRSPNGNTFDWCRGDAMCNAPNQCMQRNYTSCAYPQGGPCYCLGRNLTECVWSSECNSGELCARVDGRTGRHCYSIAALERFEKNRYSIFGKNGNEISPKNGTGFTSDSCQFDWNCLEPRRCTHYEDVFGGCAGRRMCRCKLLEGRICQSDANCVSGEQCGNVRGSWSKGTCESKIFIASYQDFVPIAEVHNTTSKPIVANSAGLSWDPCRSQTDCVSTESAKRVCYHLTENWRACVNRSACYCVPQTPLSCNSSIYCAEGEACAIIKDSLSIKPLCVSSYVLVRNDENLFEEYGAEPSPTAEIEETLEPAVVPTPMSPSPSKKAEEEVCIDMSHLGHLPLSNLVYRRPRRATVLCDEYGSCATKGHIVIWNGRSMMMRTYCSEFAKCETRIRMVNSPRMELGLRIQSHTKGMQFSALAARFESVTEERILVGMIAIGL